MPEKIVEKNQDWRIPIVTTNETLAIHARMVAHEHAFIVSLQNAKKWPTKTEKELISDARIIMSDFDISPESQIGKILEKYNGTYLNVDKNLLKPSQNPAKLSETIERIEKIRDALGDVDPQNKWEYYDNAGTYTQLLRDTYKKLNNRLWEYNKTNYILVGENIDNFLDDFWLRKYAIWKISEYDNAVIFIKTVQDLQEKSPVSAIITSVELPSQIKSSLKKMNITTYTLPDIQDDTSGWWYIRFIEKMVSTFVSAYDTYD